MPKRYEYVYEVEGITRFPLDMLRYDRSSPARETDSYEILRSMTEAGSTSHVVRLSGPKPPEVGRWKSFGWLLSQEPEKRATI